MKATCIHIFLIFVSFLGLVSCGPDSNIERQEPTDLPKELKIDFVEKGHQISFNSEKLSTDSSLEIEGYEEELIRNIEFNTRCQKNSISVSKSGEKNFEKNIRILNLLPLSIFQPSALAKSNWECEFKIHLFAVEKSKDPIEILFKNDIEISSNTTQLQPLTHNIDRNTRVASSGDFQFSSLIRNHKKGISKTERITLFCDIGQFSQASKRIVSFSKFINNAEDIFHPETSTSLCRIIYEPNSSQSKLWNELAISPVFIVSWEKELPVLAPNRWVRPLAAIEKNDFMELLRFKLKNPNPYPIYLNPKDLHGHGSMLIAPILRKTSQMNPESNTYDQPSPQRTPLYWEIGGSKQNPTNLLKPGKIVEIPSNGEITIKAFGGKAYNLYSLYSDIGKNICHRWPHGILAGFDKLPKLNFSDQKEEYEKGIFFSTPLKEFLSLEDREEFQSRFSMFFRFSKNHSTCPRHKGYPFKTSVETFTDHTDFDFFFIKRQ